jgi:hypothetical protein
MKNTLRTLGVNCHFPNVQLKVNKIIKNTRQYCTQLHTLGPPPSSSRPNRLADQKRRGTVVYMFVESLPVE